MARLHVKRFSQPDETRPFVDRGHADILKFDERTVGRGVFEPGWRWSSHVRPLAQTESCQTPHVLLGVSGRLAIQMDDGEEAELGPGDIAVVPPGHDAWVLGDEACVLFDFGDLAQYAVAAHGVEAGAETSTPA